MGRMGLAGALLLLLIITACSKPVIFDDNSTNGSIVPRVITTQTDARPDIPRVNPPEATPDDSKFTNPGEQPRGRQPMPIVNKTPGLELDVPLGDSIGKHHPLLDSGDFPLLKHQPIRVTGNLLVGYEERLRFDFGANSTGKVIFSKDELDESIGSFLVFEEDKPILEYTAILNQGTYYEMQGREIQILGHKYAIAEVTNYSVSLFGTDTPNNLFFEDGKKLVVNNSRRSGTLAIVRPNVIGFVLLAEGEDDGNILLAPGESLTENIGHDRLASRILDVRYKGAPMQNATHVKIKRTKFGYTISADTFAGARDVPLVETDAGRLVLGKAGDALRITPCASSTYCIAPDSKMLLTSHDGRTFLMQYSDVDPQGRLLILRDTLGNRYDFKYAGTPGVDAWTDVILNKVAFRAHIGARSNATGEHNISIQGLSGDIVVADGTIVRVHEPSNTTLPIDIIIPRAGYRSETTRIDLVYDNSLRQWRIVAGNLTFVEDEDTHDTFAMTPYGMAVFLDKNKRDLADNEGDEAILLVPRSQAYGIVSVEG